MPHEGQATNRVTGSNGNDQNQALTVASGFHRLFITCVHPHSSFLIYALIHIPIYISIYSYNHLLTSHFLLKFCFLT